MQGRLGGKTSYPDPEEPDAHVANARHWGEDKVHGDDSEEKERKKKEKEEKKKEKERKMKEKRDKKSKT